jgi:hypothetical protein
MGEIFYLLFNLSFWLMLIVCLFALSFVLVVASIFGYGAYRLVRFAMGKFSAGESLPKQAAASNGHNAA